MKKMMIFMGVMVAAMMSATAAPLYLTFRTIDGAERSFAAESIEMTVSNGKLLVSNSETQIEFNLAALASMRFTDKEVESSVTNVTDDNKKVTVYSLKGNFVGLFDSARIAESKLPSGTYLFKTASETVKKIIL